MIDHASTAGGAVEQPMPECWRVVGVSGDRSCPELERFIHCRNCPVLAEAARSFFDREAPPGYLESWRTVLEEPEAPPDADAASLLVFRVDKEWLALPATALIEVTPIRRLHAVPHRAGTPLAGLVNIRGQLQLCLSLHAVLGLAGGPTGPERGLQGTPPDTAMAGGREPSRAGFGTSPPPEPPRTTPESIRQGPSVAEGVPRLLVIERLRARTTDRWVLGVDDVAGVHRVPRSTLRAVPATVGQAAARCSAALFDWEERTVAVLDEDRLFDALARAVES